MYQPELGFLAKEESVSTSESGWFTNEEIVRWGPIVSSPLMVGRVPGRRLTERDDNQLTDIILAFFYDAWEKGTLPKEIFQTSDEAQEPPPTPE